MSEMSDRLVAEAEAAVEGATRKIEKFKGHLDDAKDALSRAKDDLRSAKAEARKAPASEPTGDNESVEAHAEAAEIKGEAN